MSKRYRFEGTHEGEHTEFPSIGKRVEFEGVGIWRLEGGKTTESWYIADFLCRTGLSGE